MPFTTSPIGRCLASPGIILVESSLFRETAPFIWWQSSQYWTKSFPVAILLLHFRKLHTISSLSLMQFKSTQVSVLGFPSSEEIQNRSQPQKVSKDIIWFGLDSGWNRHKKYFPNNSLNTSLHSLKKKKNAYYTCRLKNSSWNLYFKWFWVSHAKAKQIPFGGTHFKLKLQDVLQIKVSSNINSKF